MRNPLPSIFFLWDGLSPLRISEAVRDFLTVWHEPITPVTQKKSPLSWKPFANAHPSRSGARSVSPWGGTPLLKRLGEAPDQYHWLHAAAAVSAPIDLVAAGNHLSDNLFNREIYSRHFLRTLKPKVLEKSRRFPGVIDVMRINQARDLRDFDNAYTAPMHGFKDAADYWYQSSSKPWLKKIQIPTLVLNARNDPFLPEQVLPGPEYGSPSVVFISLLRVAMSVLSRACGQAISHGCQSV